MISSPAILWPTAATLVSGSPPLPAQLPGPPSGLEVHIYAVALTVSPTSLGSFAAVLSEAEREQAARFHFELHRNRFIVAHAALRWLLAACLGVEPQELGFTHGANGKPALRMTALDRGLEFNLSHSEDLGLIAVTTAGMVGVDVERIRPLKDADDLVARFFSPRESALFRKLPEAEKPAAFFNLWTRKEAWLKATGEGIGHSLHRVEVSFLPGEPARLLELPSSLDSKDQWALHELAPAAGYAAALAVAAPGALLRCWQLNTLTI